MLNTAVGQSSHTLPLVAPAFETGLQGFVRIINHSDRAGTVNVTASNGRMLTDSSSFALAIRSHCPSWRSKASSVRSVGSTSHRWATGSRA